MDRDGVIIENVPTYVRSWVDVHIFPDALQGLARLRRLDYSIVIITNQSAVGRGIISRGEADAINERLVQVITAAGGQVDGVFLCPHAPLDQCQCRKPKPGLLVQAASALSIDLRTSILVGDALTDIQAGQAAGVGTNILVATGRGKEQAALPQVRFLAPFLQFPRFSDVVDALCSGLLSI